MSTQVEGSPLCNPTIDAVRAEFQAKPTANEASGLKSQKLELNGYQANRDAMRGEMSGYWVGPCGVDDFFKLTMPIHLKEGAKEELPTIKKKYFAKKKLRNEVEVFAEFKGFFMRTEDESHFPGLKLMDNSRHADPDSKNGSQVKPDSNVHKEDDMSVTDTHPTRFGTALSATEIKKGKKELFNDAAKDGGAPYEVDTKEANDARGQLATYAVEFCARQHRTHLFLVYIYFPFVRFIRFDRSGALVSKPFNLAKDCTPLIRFYSRFSQMTDAERGYDTTVTLADKFEAELARDRLKEWAPKHQRPVFKMDVYDDQLQVDDENVKKPQPRKFLVWGSLADPDSPLGRATRGYPALEVTEGLEHAKDSPLVFLKEQWRSKALRPEIDTLRELNNAGIEHVPTLVCGGDLPGQVTRTHAYATEIGRTGGKVIDQRTHVRFVVKEVGRPIEQFSSSKEMFQAVYDAFQGHKQAYDVCGLLHRDVSGGNILLLDDGGLLNDWDMAVKVKDVERDPRAHERTGTWDFMSIDLLSGEKRPHKVSGDLESFFWVVLYYSLLYLPHNKVGKLNEIIPAVFEQYTYYDEAKGGDGKFAAVMGGKYIGVQQSRPCLEFTHSKPLSDFVVAMLDLLREWRLQMHAAVAAQQPKRFAPVKITSNPTVPSPVPEHKHADVEYIWEGTLGLNEWSTDDKAKLQIVKKPKGATGQAPAAGTGGGGSKKRKSTTTQDDLVSDAEEHKSKKAKSITQEAPANRTKEHKPKKSKKTPTTGTRKSTRLLRTGSTS